MFCTLLQSQNCSCIDCPKGILPLSSGTGTVNITGSTNNDLQNPGQGVCGVLINFKSGYIWDTEITLTSPSGQVITLVGPVTTGQGASTIVSRWNILFRPCFNPVTPDTPYMPKWSNAQKWKAIKVYTGSYYPANDCFENLTGAVNGNWTINYNNNNPFYTDSLVGFSMIFCDKSGIGCYKCEADGGDITNFPNLVACEGDTILNIKKKPIYGPIKPDSSLYSYKYLVFDTKDTLHKIQSNADFRTLSAGKYKVFGLSFFNTDSILLPKAGKVTSKYLKDTLKSINAPFCGKLTSDSFLLNIGARYLILKKDTICFGKCITINNKKHCTSGSYNDTLSTINGCDSIIKTDLIVLPKKDTTLIFSRCGGDSVIYNTKTYKITGIYKDTLVAKNGCDSTITLNMRFSTEITNDTLVKICSGDSLFFKGNFIKKSGVYSDTLISVQGCDSIVNLEVKLLNRPQITRILRTCNGDTIKVGNKFYLLSGNYKDTLMAANGCDSIVNSIITFFPTYRDTFYKTICKGDSVRIGINYYKNTGIYSSLLISKNGCDSIVFLDLKVINPKSATINTSICQGDSLLIGAKYYNTSGTYTDTLKGFEGCDSIINIVIKLFPKSIQNIDTSICTGDSLRFGNKIYYASGNYIDTLTTVNGCDSVLKINILQNNPVTRNISTRICNGETYNIGDSTYSTTGVYKYFFKRSNKCDSIINLFLIVSNLTERFLVKSICAGDSVSVGGKYYKTSGNYIDTISAGTGCDSIIDLTLTVIDSSVNNLKRLICEGDSVVLDNKVFKTSGYYTIKTFSSIGCDSIIHLDLNIIPSKITNLVADFCEGNFYIFNTKKLTKPGIYRDTLPAINGCDSILVLTLKELKKTYKNISATICNETYNFNGNILFNGGIYKDSIPNSIGCDSIITLTLTKVTEINTVLTKTICKGQFVAIGGKKYEKPGIFIDTLSSSSACDSIVRLNLSVINSFNINNIVQICSDDTLEIGIKKYTTSGNYRDTLQSMNGCDSIVNTDLTVLKPITNLIAADICDGKDYKVGTKSYKATGQYIDTLSNSIGCDSIITLKLSVFPNFTNTKVMSICKGDTVFVDKYKHTITGIYKDTLKTFRGCDSIINIDLTVIAPLFSNVDTAICNGKNVMIGGSSYKNPGQYIDTLKRTNGCDSIIQLKLTVNPNQTTNLIRNICYEDVVKVGTNTYRNTGVYKDTLRTFQGCDSIVNLNLTQRPLISKLIDTTLCFNNFITIGNKSYTTLGNYVDTLKSSLGCDSIVTLNLKYYPEFKKSIDTTLCFGGTIKIGNQTYGTSGLYTKVLQNSNRCDSTITLKLTVRNQIRTVLDKVICFDDAFVFNNKTYRQSGVYRDTFSSYTSCDSIAELKLIVLPKNQKAINAAICIGDTYFFGTKKLQFTGTYYDTLTSYQGCDSFITLNLKVESRIENDIIDTICVGQFVKVGNNVYNQTGNYIDTLAAFAGCDSIVKLKLVVKSCNITYIFTKKDVNCFGISDGFISVIMSGGITPYKYKWDNITNTTKGQGTFNGAFDTIKGLSKGIYTITITDNTGLQSFINTTISEPQKLTITLTDIFPPACGNDRTGSATAAVNGGTLPYKYRWDGISSTNKLTNADASLHIFQAIDNNNCNDTAQLVFGTTTPILLKLEIKDPKCFGENTGEINIIDIKGGKPNYSISIDNSVFTTFRSFKLLDAGSHRIIIKDDINCKLDTIVLIQPTTQLNIELGDNIDLKLGDSTTLNLKINIADSLIKSITWDPRIDSCSRCTSYVIKPIHDLKYKVIVIDKNGCSASDNLLINVSKDLHTYIPNVFTPNADGYNDICYIIADNGVKMIQSFAIYDRWGEQVFGANNFFPNDPSQGWNGYFKGILMNPAVFVYYAELLMVDGSIKYLQGDITLIR